MALSRGGPIGMSGMQSLVRYMMGEGNQMYKGASIDIIFTEPQPATANYQRSNRLRFEVLGKRMLGYLNETGDRVVNLSLALVDEADKGYKFFHSMSLPSGELDGIVKGD
jgi:hypothetical protein